MTGTGYSMERSWSKTTKSPSAYIKVRLTVRMLNLGESEPPLRIDNKVFIILFWLSVILQFFHIPEKHEFNLKLCDLLLFFDIAKLWAQTANFYQ